MKRSQPSQIFAFRPFTSVVAAMLLLVAGVLAAAYQHHAGQAEHRSQLTVQAKILAASVTAAIAFDDRAAAREYVDALMLDPRLDAVAVYNEAHRKVAGFQRPGSDPIADLLRRGGPLPDDPLLVEVPARQGGTAIGRVYLRATEPPVSVQLARYSGVGLLTLMAVLTLSALGVAQRTLTRANVALHQRALQLAEANERLSAEMEQRSRTEEALRQSQKMEAIGQLSGGVAHDFNNLLMIIRGSLHRLQTRLQRDDQVVERIGHFVRRCIGDDAGPASSVPPLSSEDLAWLDDRPTRYAKVAHYLDMAQDGIERAASLTQRLLSFARRQPLSPKRLNLDDLVRGIQPLLQHSAGANARSEYRLDSRWEVLCDANQMENAILNLVINGCDAMPEGGQITVATADVRVDAEHPLDDLPPGDYVHLSVQDTGTGMSDEVRRKAFDPFFTTKPVGKGTGLGLSTILGYVLQSHGVATIQSELGRGTTVHIFLPRDGSVDTPSEEA